MTIANDLYKNKVDFTSLALRYPDFAKKLKANRQLDFSDPESVRQLTKALLHRDFDLTITLPEDRLCPPVPNRFNYILFVQRLLDSTQVNYNDKYHPSRRVIALDIGTGASAIYPLLACRQRPSWLFLATEIDAKSRAFGTRNIQDNNLQSRIKIIECEANGETIIPTPELRSFERIDVLLTNPPFYTSESELQTLARQKARPPNSACTGAPVEMICPGGEVSFVSRIIDESVLPSNKAKIQWYSSMVGKLGSVTILIDKLKETGCTNYAVTEFIQGRCERHRCSREEISAFSNRTRYSHPGEYGHVLQRVNAEIPELPGIEWHWKPDLQAGIGRSWDGDVWSRHARRRQKKQSLDENDSMDMGPTDKETNPTEPQFVFRIMLHPPSTEPRPQTTDPNTTTLRIRWLQGDDPTVFESFHGWLKRKLAS